METSSEDIHGLGLTFLGIFFNPHANLKLPTLSLLLPLSTFSPSVDSVSGLRDRFLSTVVTRRKRLCCLSKTFD